MLELFQGPRHFVAEDGSISDGRRGVDGRIHRSVEVNIIEHRRLVTVSVSDAVKVEAAMDPFLALALGEALINAALAIYLKPGEPPSQGAYH